jgi:hypothetical protein
MGDEPADRVFVGYFPIGDVVVVVITPSGCNICHLVVLALLDRFFLHCDDLGL